MFNSIHCSYVGIYGDADPLDAAQWSSMTYSVPSDTRTWNALTSTCSNMFNGELPFTKLCFIWFHLFFFTRFSPIFTYSALFTSCLSSA